MCSYFDNNVPYAQFQGEKLRKSIACGLAIFFYLFKEPLSFKKRFHYWFCCLFVVYSINPVSCSASRELRDRQRSNALRNFWLVLFFKFNNNKTDDCNSCFVTDVRENNNLHSLTNWFYNKNNKKKEAKTHLVRHKHLQPHLLKPCPEMFNGVMMPPPGIF